MNGARLNRFGFFTYDYLNTLYGTDECSEPYPRDFFIALGMITDAERRDPRHSLQAFKKLVLLFHPDKIRHLISTSSAEDAKKLTEFANTATCVLNAASAYFQNQLDSNNSSQQQ